MSEEKREGVGKLYIANAFSLGMLDMSEGRFINLTVYEYPIPKNVEEFRKWVSTWLPQYRDRIVSAVGHESTAKVLSQLLGIEVPVNRVEIKLKPKDAVLVFQILKRLPEGKVLNEDELKELLDKGLVKLYGVSVVCSDG